jgi:hypothetical protein
MSLVIDTLMEHIEVALEDAEPEDQVDLIDRLIATLEYRKRDIDNTPQVRNLARFTTEDAEAVLGRPLTEGEYRALVKTLENSSLGEVFAECVDLVTTDNG